jgi:hypothetical protein
VFSGQKCMWQAMATVNSRKQGQEPVFP